MICIFFYFPSEALCLLAQPLEMPGFLSFWWIKDLKSKYPRPLPITIHDLHSYITYVKGKGSIAFLCSLRICSGENSTEQPQDITTTIFYGLMEYV